MGTVARAAHALVEFGAQLREVARVRAARVRVAGAGIERGAERAEVGVSLAHGAQPAQQQFEHDRVVEQADHLDIVRDQVVGIAEVDQRADHVRALGLGERPRIVLEHQDQALHLDQAALHVARHVAGAEVVERVLRRIDDLRLVRASARRARALERSLESRDVGGFQFERDAHGRRSVANARGRVTLAGAPGPPAAAGDCQTTA